MDEAAFDNQTQVRPRHRLGAQHSAPVAHHLQFAVSPAPDGESQGLPCALRWHPAGRALGHCRQPGGEGPAAEGGRGRTVGPAG